MVIGVLIIAAWLIVLSFVVQQVKDKVEYQVEQIQDLAKLLSDTRQSLARAEAAKALGLHIVR